VDSAAIEPHFDKANARNAFLAGFLGWTFDAFDFFVLTYVLAQVAKDFHRSIPEIAVTLVASLMMRPVGAFIFGLMADRFGRRLPLMVDILFFSAMEVGSGLAPNYRVFLILRILYGIGMGGAWGAGAALAMESIPPRLRGVFSGLFQEGYALGNLFAAIAFWVVFPRWGWRAMFFIGVIPALLTLFILSKVKESEVWKAAASKQKDWRNYFRELALNWKRFVYLVILMAMMNFLSHGTQDLYPTYLQQQRHYLPHVTAIVSIISMLGAIAGGALIGLYSDRAGRRRAMVASVVGGLVVLPLWVLSPTLSLLALGAFLMQFMVHGAWGVIPAHINELSPNRVRGFLPGFCYQLGVVFAASAPFIQASLSRHYSYGYVMGIFVAIAMVITIIVIAAGPEEHGTSFGHAPARSEAPQVA
jgi:MFS transporter, SHS family, lactate transporter